jgi:hypothetical protein
MAAGNSGTALAALLAPGLAAAFGWTNVFGIVLIPLVIVLVAFCFMAKDAPDAPPPKTLAEYLKVLKDRDAWWFMFFHSVTFGGFVGLASSLVIHLNTQYGLDPKMAGFFTAGCVCAGSLVRPIGGNDNATALVIDVLALLRASLRDSLENAASLPLPHHLKVGHEIDGLVLEEVLHDARETLLYRVRNLRNGQQLVLKTLQPALQGDAGASAALLMEEWRARRVLSPYFPQVVPSDEKSGLYYLITWHAGATVQARLNAVQHFPVGEVVRLGIALLKGIAALHRLDIVHRDIKPANIHLGQDGALRILDLRVALSLGERKAEDPVASAGTPSYMAPELLDAAPPAPGFDLYAAGVTLYLLLTRKYPYGEIEPFQKPKFGEPVRPTRWRPEIPGWLENIVLKAVAREAKDRFETAEEFLLALERGPSRPLAASGRRPLVQRNPLMLWKIVAAASLAVNFLLLLKMLH